MLSLSKQKAAQPEHLYRGHRRESFVPLDVPEMVELRARGRTFHGAYARTALGNLGYSAVVLKLFDRRFFRIGLLYVILAVMLFILSVIRRRHSRHDFSDYYADCGRFDGDNNHRDNSKPSAPRKRIFGRPFVTAGWVVVVLTTVVAIVEIALLAFILEL